MVYFRNKKCNFCFEGASSSAGSTWSETSGFNEVPLPAFSPSVEQALRDGKAGEVMDQVSLLNV